VVDDYRRTIEESQSGFERLVGSIPGYKGYKERELRRESDALLRRFLADGLAEQRRRLVALMTRLADSGRIQELTPFERANLKLETLIDRVSTAAHGYAGLFDAIKVRQRELDALYEYDAALAEGIDRVAEAIDAIEARIVGGEQASAEVSALTDLVQEISETFGKRAQVLAGARPPRRRATPSS
jgi:hypothetical protein